MGLERDVLNFEYPVALNGQVIGLGKPGWLCQNTSMKLIFPRRRWTAITHSLYEVGG